MEVISIWGDVATIRFTLSLRDPPERGEDLESALYYEILEVMPLLDPFFQHRREPESEQKYRQLKNEIQDLTRRFLGPEFESRIDDVRQGSIITFTVIITAATLVYKAVKDYPDLIRGLELLRTHLQQLIEKVLGGEVGHPPVQLVVSSSLTPGLALYFADSLTTFRSVVNQLRNFLVYIAVTTSLLVLGVLASILILLLDYY